MSQENVEIVRAIYARVGEGDFRASVDLLDPHIVFLMMQDAPDAEVYVGVEADAAATRGLFDTWADFTLKAEEFILAAAFRVTSVTSPSGRFVGGR